MSTENDENPDQETSQSLVGRSGPHAERFVDHGDLTNLSFEGVLLTGVSAQQALFSGTLFRKCEFRVCNFKRCDFEGVVFEECKFIECDFSIADFRSAEIARTLFQGCKFDDGATDLSTFTECIFDSCQYPYHGFDECTLIDCRLRDCNFARSGNLHNNYVRTTFERTDLADCTSQYHLFTDCTFIDSRINAEAVGLMFGLTRENLAQVGLTFRGNRIENVGTTVDDLIASLMTTYRARGWPFAAAILELNFFSERDRGLADVFAAIEATAASTLPLKANEIRFLARIIERLSQENSLALLPIAKGLDSVVRSAELRDGRDVEPLKVLHHALKDAEHRELRAIDVTLAPLASLPDETNAFVAFVFHEKPSVSLLGWFHQLEEAGGKIGAAPHFVKAERGSYIEYFLITPSVLCSLLIAMNTVERIIDRLIYIRARSELLFSRRLPPVIRQRALEPLAAPGRGMARALRSHLKTVSDPNNENVVEETKRLTKHIDKIRIETDADGDLPQDD